MNIRNLKPQIPNLKLLLPPLLCLFAVTAHARDDYPRQAGLDAQLYRIRLSIADAGAEISGETEVVFAVRAEGVREVALDFPELTVDGVNEGGRAAKFTREGGRLRVA
ncbi:MAG TPA: hypothetical protein VF521_13035, partial [Pyrinomonadaceae bacterium]